MCDIRNNKGRSNYNNNNNLYCALDTKRLKTLKGNNPRDLVFLIWIHKN